MTEFIFDPPIGSPFHDDRCAYSGDPDRSILRWAGHPSAGQGLPAADHDRYYGRLDVGFPFKAGSGDHHIIHGRTSTTRDIGIRSPYLLYKDPETRELRGRSRMCYVTEEPGDPLYRLTTRHWKDGPLARGKVTGRVPPTATAFATDLLDLAPLAPGCLEGRILRFRSASANPSVEVQITSTQRVAPSPYDVSTHYFVVETEPLPAAANVGDEFWILRKRHRRVLTRTPARRLRRFRQAFDDPICQPELYGHNVMVYDMYQLVLHEDTGLWLGDGSTVDEVYNPLTGTGWVPEHAGHAVVFLPPHFFAPLHRMKFPLHTYSRQEEDVIMASWGEYSQAFFGDGGGLRVDKGVRVGTNPNTPVGTVDWYLVHFSFILDAAFANGYVEECGGESGFWAGYWPRTTIYIIWIGVERSTGEVFGPGPPGTAAAAVFMTWGGSGDWLGIGQFSHVYVLPGLLRPGQMGGDVISRPYEGPCSPNLYGPLQFDLDTIFASPTEGEPLPFHFVRLTIE